MRDGRGWFVYAPRLPWLARVYWRTRLRRRESGDRPIPSLPQNASVRVVLATADPRHYAKFRNIIQRLDHLPQEILPSLPIPRLIWAAAEDADRAEKVNVGLLNYRAAMVNLAERRYHHAPADELATYEGVVTVARGTLISLALDGRLEPDATGNGFPSVPTTN